MPDLAYVPAGGRCVVVGAGGHAKVVIDCLRFAGWNVVGCTDPSPIANDCAGVPVVGTDDKLPDLLNNGVMYAFCGLGDNQLRETVGDRLISLGFDVPVVIGPGAIVSSSVKLGRGVAIMPGAIVNIDSVVQAFAVINTNANLDHDCFVGRAAHVGPGVSVAGGVHIGERSIVATGCAVIPQRKIGRDSIVGAGSVVVQDIPDGCVAFGNPARVRSKLSPGV